MDKKYMDILKEYLKKNERKAFIFSIEMENYYFVVFSFKG